MGKKCSDCATGLGIFGINSYGTFERPFCSNCSQKILNRLESNSDNRTKKDKFLNNLSPYEALVQKLQQNEIKTSLEEFKSVQKDINDKLTVENIFPESFYEEDEIAELRCSNGDFKLFISYKVNPNDNKGLISLAFRRAVIYATIIKLAMKYNINEFTLKEFQAMGLIRPDESIRYPLYSILH